jgi:hypothetical protein
MRIGVLKSLTIVSIAGSAAIGFAVYRHLIDQPDDLQDRPVQPWSPELGEGASLDLAEAKPRSYEETFARPIFSPTRRSFVPPPPAPPPAPEPMAEPPPPPPVAASDPSQLQLKGVMIGGATAKALLVSPESPSGQWLTVGTTIMGWKVTKIADDTVSLDGGAAAYELKLYVDNGPN